MSLFRTKSARNLYLWAVAAVGIGVVGHALRVGYQNPPPFEWFVLAALTLLTGSFTVKVPSETARLSVSETFVFTSTLLFGVDAGTITAVLDALVMSFWLKRSSVSRLLFNVAASAIAIWTSAQSFFALSGLEPGGIHSRTLGQAVGPLFVFALVYFLINSALVAGAVRTEREQPLLKIWSQFLGLSINYFVGGSIAVLLVAYTPEIDITSLGIIGPILLISYFTFRTSMGRLEDATKHVGQLNELYLSTIETLAMAVDAKDQITHGHIRRVQVYATELAKRLGVSDERQLKAIQTAALLHDMGKLAIPEHILNKPGKLTAGEFEKMKRHADIGADLLSSIPFPYPVVPIVRHHHENWDGTGYPNRISGTDIPLGARILSVVDCFDALTSDRPYRPRLTNEAAFDILRDRRGSMYDPLIVDTFIASYDAISPAAIRAGQQARSLISVDEFSASDSTKALHEIQTGSAESIALAEARRLMAKAQTIGDAISAVSHVLRQFTPATIVALYEYQTNTDSLRCVYAAGDVDGLLTGFEIPHGERTTGWVGANRAPILNSSAILDLGTLVDLFSPSLKSSIAVPAGQGGGVLTLYSTLEAPFTERHQYIAEQIAASLSEHMTRPTRVASAIVRFPEPASGSHVRK
jgi:putative nucleotidyltransferase with HDIG domain